MTEQELEDAYRKLKRRRAFIYAGGVSLCICLIVYWLLGLFYYEMRDIGSIEYRELALYFGVSALTAIVFDPHKNQEIRLMESMMEEIRGQKFNKELQPSVIFPR